MARFEQDREDLLAEATALVERMELRAPNVAGPVVVGFRRDGCASFYFGADEALHFNSARELRRAFLAGRLYKAERGQLAALDRVRGATVVALVRTDLTAAETRELLAAAQRRLSGLLATIRSGNVELVGQVPAAGEVRQRVERWLDEIQFPLAIAATPHAR